ncbi:hypothetical protein D9758_018700 [Tetrapyrgos nigripes]|uniref:Oxidase ustYa n=1 Tax=Tetrapyrgos nigripes TaxID=182062 RepID=A0A8H5FAM5_9AGAR|nr:hypothetical protein D9758_018700 [Tetrapyrgos nigripes]
MFATRTAAVRIMMVLTTAITLCNMYITGASVKDWLHSTRGAKKQFRTKLPILVNTAALRVEANDYYNIHSDQEWSSLFTPLPGYPFGFVQLESEEDGTKAFFEPAVYHQMHCLDILRQMIVHHDWSDRASEERAIWHVNHCLNMVRQAILCNADTTLEPSYIFDVVNGRNQSAASGLDVMHVCRDWSQIRSYVEENYRSTLAHGTSKENRD